MQSAKWFGEDLTLVCPGYSQGEIHISISICSQHSSIQPDTLAQEQHLSGGNKVVLGARQPFCFTDKNYKISVLEICSFFSSHIIICLISFQTVLSDLLFFLWTSCPWQAASPQKPSSQAYVQRTFFISTASQPSLPTHSASDDSHDYLLPRFFQHPLFTSYPLQRREWFCIHHFANSHVHSL